MSDLKTSQFSVRCTAELSEKVQSYAKQLGADPPVFIRRCLEEISAMIENPEKNELPEIIALLRFAKAYKKNPTELKTSAPRKTA